MSRETIAFHREFCAKGARNNFSAVRLLINFDKGCFCVVYPCSENKLEVFAFDIFSVLRLCDGISPHCSIVVCLVISQTKRVWDTAFDRHERYFKHRAVWIFRRGEWKVGLKTYNKTCTNAITNHLLLYKSFVRFVLVNVAERRIRDVNKLRIILLPMQRSDEANYYLFCEDTRKLLHFWKVSWHSIDTVSMLFS